MKILFVCNEYPPLPHGGIGSFTKLMAESLVQHTHEAVVFGYGTESSIETVNGVKVILIQQPKKKKNKWFSVLQQVTNRNTFYKKLKKIARQEQVDLIETYDWTAPLIFKIKNIPLVTRMHGSNSVFNSYSGIKISSFNHYFENKILKKSDYLLSVSDFISKETQKLFQLTTPIKTIYNGVDTRRFQPLNLERDANQLLLVGRMHPYKGFDKLFLTLNTVFENNEKLYVSIICTVVESFKENLLTLVDKKHHHRIHFLGRIPNEELVNYYSKANLLVLPSLAEAFPIIPLEAMACGTPVIMSNRFSSPEIVEDEKDGFLVNVLDTAGFAEKILSIFNKQTQIDAMRGACRDKMVQLFDQEKIIQENIGYYKKVIDGYKN